MTNTLAEDLAGLMNDPRHMSDEALIREIERAYNAGEVGEDLLPVVRAELTMHYRHARYWNAYFKERYEKQRAEGQEGDPPVIAPVPDYGMSEEEAREVLAAWQQDENITPSNNIRR